MLIYNVTTQMDWSIHDKWLDWMRETHLPDVLATECFTHYRLVRVLEVDEIEGPTYAVQFFCDSHQNYESYISKYAPQLREDGLKKWGNACISFRSLMEVVH